MTISVARVNMYTGHGPITSSRLAVAGFPLGSPWQSHCLALDGVNYPPTRRFPRPEANHRNSQTRPAPEVDQTCLTPAEADRRARSRPYARPEWSVGVRKPRSVEPAIACPQTANQVPPIAGLRPGRHSARVRCLARRTRRGGDAVGLGRSPIEEAGVARTWICAIC
jgi:hypothetical protein